MLAERIVEQTVEGPVVWDAIFDSHVTLLMKSEFEELKQIHTNSGCLRKVYIFNIFQIIDLVNDLLARTTSIA